MATTSTSFISAGGLKKCIPTTLSGPGVLARRSRTTGREEVLEARIAPGPKPRRRAQRSRAAATARDPQAPAWTDLAATFEFGRSGMTLATRTAPPAASASLGAPHLAPHAFAERLDDPLAAGLQGGRVGVSGMRPLHSPPRAGELGDTRSPSSRRRRRRSSRGSCRVLTYPHHGVAKLSTRQWPLKLGERFSRKACMPSTRSSVAIASS